MRADLIERLREAYELSRCNTGDYFSYGEGQPLLKEAADALASQDPVAVKPLEWEWQPNWAMNNLRAKTPIGSYNILVKDDTGRIWSTPGQSVHLCDQSGDVETLKARCEASFKSDVRACVASPIVPVAAKAEAEGWRPAETCPKERGTLIEVQVFEHIQRWDASKFHNAFDGDNRKFLWRPFTPTREGEGQ